MNGAHLGSARADDSYNPRATVLKRVDSVHLHADGSKVMEVESLVRIDTETAAEDWGEQRLDYSESLETAEVLEAWTQTPDGKRIPVTPDRIRTLQAHDEGGVSFNDDKVQVLIYPAVTVGAQVYLRWRVHQHTPYFAGRASWGVEYPPGMVFEDARVTIRHDAGMAVKVDARGLDGGLVPQKTSAAEPPTVRSEYTFRQTKAWPPERSRVALSDFAAGIDVTTFDGSRRRSPTARS